IGQYPPVHVAPGRAETLRFAIAVGTGDTGTLQAAQRDLLGAQSDLVALSGTVVDDQGGPVAAARVHVTNAAGDRVAGFARTAADGSWTSPVRSGTWAVRALADDRPASAVQTLAVPPSGLIGVRLQLGARSRIECAATGSGGHPIPAKLVLDP